jgi:predicted house-cleaning noncanonical NTP pyrophosphatase (MazG superfamily)
MVITERALVKYLEENRLGTSYTLQNGTVFTFEIFTPRVNGELFPYRMQFFSLRWKPSTKKWISAAAIDRFLSQFNEHNERPLSDYVNETRMDHLPSKSTSALYFVHILKRLIETRRPKKLVRDRIPEIIRKDGREPIVTVLKGRKLTQALEEKLVEEHEEYIESRSVEELADMAEVLFSLAKVKGVSEEDFIKTVEEKRLRVGGFDEGLYYEGDRS